METPTLSRIQDILNELGLSDKNYCVSTGTQTHTAGNAAWHAVHSPADGQLLGHVQYAGEAE
ncbi:MAG: hypothetical protein AAF752_15675, partial [Bacteroidota bacterium]